MKNLDFGCIACSCVRIACPGSLVCDRVIPPAATKTEISEQIADESMREYTRRHVNKKDGAMEAGDVAAAILLPVTLQPWANVADILIMPTIDTSPM
jgi:NADP-dependent 3-hydroxy acid dehydrogenase YdfG